MDQEATRANAFAAHEAPAAPAKTVRRLEILQVVLIAGALVTIVLSSRADQWQDASLFFLLLAVAAFARLLAIEVQQDILVFGDFLPTLIAAVLLGPAPAAVMGLIIVQTRWLRRPMERGAAGLHARLRRKGSPARQAAWLLRPFSVHERSEPRQPAVKDEAYEPVRVEPPTKRAEDDHFERPARFLVLADSAECAWSPLIAGLVFNLVVSSTGVTFHDPLFYAVFAGVFVLALAYNLVSWDLYDVWIDGFEPGSSLRLELFLIPVEIACVLLGGLALFVYNRFGLGSTEILVLGLAAILVVYWRAQYGTVTKKRLGFEVLTTEVQELEKFHSPSGTHSAAVAHYVYAAAAEAKLPYRQQVLAYRAGLVHDVGKRDWPLPLLDGTIKDPSDEEWELMKRHATIGADWLEDIDEHELAKIVRYHHVNEDGEYGYPEHLEHRKMPKIAKLIRIADTFDVLTARDTSYTKPVSPEAAFEELHRCSNHCPEEERTTDYRGRSWSEQFNGDLVDAFRRAWEADGELADMHENRRAFEDALDFYKSGLRRKRPAHHRRTGGDRAPVEAPGLFARLTKLKLPRRWPVNGARRQGARQRAKHREEV